MARIRKGYRGEGPGAFTPDGCAVDMWDRLKVREEPDMIALGAREGARTVLELGCGAGRVTHALVERGWEVTAVDESPEMLDRVRGAKTILSTIEDLRLEERFDVVLLASYLVHTVEPESCRAMLDACRAHVADGGVVLIQREGIGWHDELPRISRHPGGSVSILASDPIGDGVRAVRIEYEFPDAHWVHEFRCRPLTDREFEAILAESNLAVDEHLDEHRTWVRALPLD
ncbi:class I SAM-dependent methyltransferase [Embleya sp. NPDC005971]|uniref:class I SAM-dependent methyltransferase n=1 Tax=Embleya sp. NPDC005971 TaxID=3156724 RepID=UPI0033ECF3EE